MLIRRLPYPAVMLLIVTMGGAARAESEPEDPPARAERAAGLERCPAALRRRRTTAARERPTSPRTGGEPCPPPGPPSAHPCPRRSSALRLRRSSCKRQSSAVTSALALSSRATCSSSSVSRCSFRRSGTPPLVDRQFPVVEFAAGGPSLVGIGNVIEGFGWSFTIRGGRERDRLRRSGVEFAAVSAARPRAWPLADRATLPAPASWRSAGRGTYRRGPSPCRSSSPYRGGRTLEKFTSLHGLPCLHLQIGSLGPDRVGRDDGNSGDAAGKKRLCCGDGEVLRALGVAAALFAPARPVCRRGLQRCLQPERPGSPERGRHRGARAQRERPQCGCAAPRAHHGRCRSGRRTGPAAARRRGGGRRWRSNLRQSVRVQ